MNKELSILKNNLGINNVFSLNDINPNKIYLFQNRTNHVSYSIYTDGILLHNDTWNDKWPSKLNPFLEGCSTCKRFEFKLSSSNIILIEKKMDNRLICNLYLNEKEILKAINSSMYGVSITEDEKIMIRKMEDGFWK